MGVAQKGDSPRGLGGRLLSGLGRLAVALAFAVCALAAIGVAVSPVPESEIDLDEVLIASPGRDFRLVEDTPLDEERLRDAGLSADVASELGDVRGHLRTWASQTTDAGVAAFVWQLPSNSDARQFLAGLFEAGEEGKQQFTVPGVEGARGYAPERPAQDGRSVAQLAFRRDSLAFRIVVATKPLDLGLARAVGTAQAEKAPEGESDAADDPWHEAGLLAGGAFAALLVFIGVLALVPRFGDTGGELVRGRATSATTHDVSHAVSLAKSDARTAFLMQVLGVSLAIPGIAPALWPDSLVLLPVAALLVGAGLMLRRRARGLEFRAAYRRVLTGRRVSRVVGLLAVSLVVAAIGILALLTSIVSGGAPQRQLGALACIGLACLPYRRARRHAALGASELMEQDERRPVLYLRSFGDDRLKITPRRDSPRRSWIERLGIRGRERFEEVIAGHLWAYGPVVAVSEPGESFPPIGSARTHLDGNTWQRGVEEWMGRAMLIVITVGATPGLGWEVAKITRLGLWNKTLLVFPPLPWELGDRWQAFRDAAATEGLDLQLTEDPSSVLVAAFAQDDLVAYVGGRRDEWHYEAALRAAADALTSSASGTAEDGAFAAVPASLA